MKRKNGSRKGFAAGVAALLCLALTPLALSAGHPSARQKPAARNGVAAAKGPAVAAFEGRVKEYVSLREKVEEKLPKLSKDSTPEQIQAHKDAFEAAVRAARAGAKPGDLLRPDIAVHIRALIKDEFKGRERQEIRKEVKEADTKGVPLRVNYPYPETKELLEMPPTLLLRLPQLPKQVKYRFVGQHMLLVDRENGLILDYMMNALP